MPTGIVVACGPSLKLHDPKLLTSYTAIGVNDAWKWARRLEHLDWLCVLNADWWDTAYGTLSWYADHERLVALERSDRPIPVGQQIPSNKGVSYFSLDISQGFYNGNSTSFALQWAVHQGLNPIYILGLDLYGEHGTSPRPANQFNLNKQKIHLREAAQVLSKAGIQVYNCNPESACDAFEYRELP